MIWYLVTERHGYTTSYYIDRLGPYRAGRLRMVSYESILGGKDFEAVPGTHIFSDIDRLSNAGTYYAVQAWRKIADLGSDARILNHPTLSMRRYELLRALFERGHNTFDVYRLTEYRQPQRWPVFIREEIEHGTSLTKLLHSPEALEAAIAQMVAHGSVRENKLVVEFCDTKDERGLYYKYAALLIGEQIIPCHLWASPDWNPRYENSITTPEMVDKERLYVETNPHERELREIFRLARIDYGRIDYSLLGDRIQVWEINTNPNLGSMTIGSMRGAGIVSAGTDPDAVERRAPLSPIAERVAAAFAEIDVESAFDGPAPKVTHGL